MRVGVASAKVSMLFVRRELGISFSKWLLVILAVSRSYSKDWSGITKIIWGFSCNKRHTRFDASSRCRFWEMMASRCHRTHAPSNSRCDSGLSMPYMVQHEKAGFGG